MTFTSNVTYMSALSKVHNQRHKTFFGKKEQVVLVIFFVEYFDLL